MQGEKTISSLICMSCLSFPGMMLVIWTDRCGFIGTTQTSLQPKHQLPRQNLRSSRLPLSQLRPSQQASWRKVLRTLNMRMTACRTCPRHTSMITRRATVWGSSNRNSSSNSSNRVSRELVTRCLLLQNRNLKGGAVPALKKMGKFVHPVLRHLYFTLCLVFSPIPLFPSIGTIERGRWKKLL